MKKKSSYQKLKDENDQLMSDLYLLTMKPAEPISLQLAKEYKVMFGYYEKNEKTQPVPFYINLN